MRSVKCIPLKSSSTSATTTTSIKWPLLKRKENDLLIRTVAAVIIKRITMIKVCKKGDGENKKNIRKRRMKRKWREKKENKPKIY